MTDEYDEYDEYDEILDAVLDSPKFLNDLHGFKLVNKTPDPPTLRQRWVKTVTLHGQTVTIEDDPSSYGLPFFIVYMPETPTPSGKSISHPGSPCNMFFYHDKPKADAHAEAMAWADQMAFAYDRMQTTLWALSREPDYVCQAKDYEPWVELAKLCLDPYVSREDVPVREGDYVIDITAIMDSEEVGPNMGGAYKATLYGDERHADVTVPIRCELFDCFKAGERWLACYRVEAA